MLDVTSGSGSVQVAGAASMGPYPNARSMVRLAAADRRFGYPHEAAPSASTSDANLSAARRINDAS